MSSWRRRWKLKPVSEWDSLAAIRKSENERLASMTDETARQAYVALLLQGMTLAQKALAVGEDKAALQQTADDAAAKLNAQQTGFSEGWTAVVVPVGKPATPASAARLTSQEAKALARYISERGIPYNQDDGLLQSILAKVTAA